MTGRIAYVAWSFPVVTQTFTVREIAALKDRGLPLDVFAAKAPRGADLDPEAASARASACYLPRASSPRTLGAALGWLLRRPLCFAGTLARCLGGRYRDEALRCRARAPGHFLVGAALASELSRRGGYARVHAQFFDAGSTAAFVASRFLGLPLSVANHTAYNPFQLEAKCAHADRIVSISAFDRGLVARQCGVPVDADKQVVSRVGIRLGEWDGLPRRPEPLRVLSVGALREKKGHAVLVRAAAALAAKGTPVTVVIAGSGAEEARLAALAAELRVSVEFLGAVGPARIRDEMTRAALFCLPCVVAANGDLDGIPVALMEAMAAGVPVVSTRVSGIPELVQDGVSGRLVAPGDADALAAALAEILGDPQRAAALAAAARAQVAALHDITRTSERLARILRGETVALDEGVAA